MRLHQTSQETRPVIPELPEEKEPSGSLVKTQSLSPAHALVSDSVGLSGAREFAFLRSSHVLLTLLAWGPHLGTSAFKKPSVSQS